MIPVVGALGYALLFCQTMADPSYLARVEHVAHLSDAGRIVVAVAAQLLINRDIEIEQERLHNTLPVGQGQMVSITYELDQESGMIVNRRIEPVGTPSTFDRRSAEPKVHWLSVAE